MTMYKKMKIPVRCIAIVLVLAACQEAPTPPVAVDPAGVIDHTEFADLALERAVREVLEQPRGPLSADQLGSVETLAAAQREIVNLDGIERLTGLRRVDLGANSISDVTPLAVLSGVQRLDLSDNEIRDLGPLSQLLQLNVLSLSRNEIVDIEPLRALRQLTHLDLQDNAIVDINPLASLRRLRLINLDNNRIRDIEPLSGLRLLTDLELSGNPLADVGAIESLERRGVQVHYYVPFESPFDAALEEDIRAHLSGLKGPITNDLLETLSFLNTTGSIRSLSGINRLVNLEALFIRFSAPDARRGFSDITPLASLEKLKALTVRDTPLESLVPLAGLVLLEELNLPNAGVSDLRSLADLRRLKFLNLAENSVVDLSPLRNLDQLTTLNLTNNEVTDLSPLLDLDGLKSVWVRGNDNLSEETRVNVIPLLRDRGAYVIGP